MIILRGYTTIRVNDVNNIIIICLCSNELILWKIDVLGI